MENVNRDLYEILGVGRNATGQEIREACLRLADTYRPDRNPGDAIAARNFEAIEKAFEVLGNPARRAAYDSSLSLHAEPRKPTSSRRGFWLLAGSAVAMVVALFGWYAVSEDSAPKGPGISQKIASLTKSKPGKSANDAYQALKKLQAITDSGINYLDYGKQLGETWFLVKTHLESPDAQQHPEIADAMKQIMKSYNKAALVWRFQIDERYSDQVFEDREPNWAIRLKMDVPDLDRFLFPTYDLASRDYGPKKRQYKLKEAVAGYWNDASAVLKQLEPSMR